ncbi:MAG: exosortase system-associated protein, TIGR04073 family [Candidatus Omnitrophica bacterium]|nr:exosortase system-associated protein, TIGR04073 family [Candidatus Omnitrophota bacterium]
MARRIVILPLTLGLALGAGIAAAATADRVPATEPRPAMCPICGRAGNDQAGYPEKAGSTLARGVTNTVFGWTEMLREPADEVKAGGNVVAGIGKGIAHTVTRTLSGLGEVLTFWTPKTNTGYVRFATDCPLCMKSRHQP